MFIFLFLLSLIPNRLYPDGIYISCLHSDDQRVLDSVVELYRVSFRAPGAEEATPQEILCHAIRLYQQYRVSSNSDTLNFVAELIVLQN